MTAQETGYLQALADVLAELRTGGGKHTIVQWCERRQREVTAAAAWNPPYVAAPTTD
jgi:hypothetical protein